MIKHIYCIYDKKANAFTNDPFMVDFKGQAMRGFADLANSRDNDIGKHPEDYSLFYLGTFNKETAEIITEAGGKVHACDALTLIER